MLVFPGFLLPAGGEKKKTTKLVQRVMDCEGGEVTMLETSGQESY